MSCLAPSPRRYERRSGSPRGMSSEAQHLSEQLHPENQSPDAGLSARIAETLTEILELGRLEDRWDLERAHAIDPQAMRAASQVVEWVGILSRREGFEWEAPEVGPLTSGGIALTWEVANREVLLVFYPGHPDLVESVAR